MSDIVTAAEITGAALLLLARREKAPPCEGSDGWTSEDHDERALAARCCAGCPLIDPCRVLADEIKATFGVWAGKDLTPSNRKATS
ncbi:MAG: WhiB family transcriptional regulator [Dermatophilaceae bacterium]